MHKNIPDRNPHPLMELAGDFYVKHERLLKKLAKAVGLLKKSEGTNGRRKERRRHKRTDDTAKNRS